MFWEEVKVWYDDGIHGIGNEIIVAVAAPPPLMVFMVIVTEKAAAAATVGGSAMGLSSPQESPSFTLCDTRSFTIPLMVIDQTWETTGSC